MFCKNCGSKIDDDSKFCEACGFAVRATVENDEQGAVPAEEEGAANAAEAAESVAANAAETAESVAENAAAAVYEDVEAVAPKKKAFLPDYKKYEGSVKKVNTLSLVGAILSIVVILAVWFTPIFTREVTVREDDHSTYDVNEAVVENKAFSYLDETVQFVKGLKIAFETFGESKMDVVWMFAEYVLYISVLISAIVLTVKFVKEIIANVGGIKDPATASMMKCDEFCKTSETDGEKKERRGQKYQNIYSFIINVGTDFLYAGFIDFSTGRYMGAINGVSPLIAIPVVFIIAAVVLDVMVKKAEKAMKESLVKDEYAALAE